MTVTWDEDEVHPQTCATCHDPHDIGTVSGDNTNATVRIYGDTPVLVSGFQATDVGSGAICMTCHNTRRHRNDDLWDDLSVSDRSRAPHGAAQADIVMGQNAYYAPTSGAPGGHGTEIEDTCVDCHMKATPPPDDLSYNSGGLNHTFYADESICAECHSPHLQAGDVQDGIEALLHQIEALIVDTSMALIDDAIDSGYTVDFDGTVISDIAQVEDLGLGEGRGRMALVLTTGGATSTVAVTSIDVVDGATTLLTLWEYGDDSLWKSAWNYFLFHNDGSLGVHNPFFASDTLIASRDALVAAAGSRNTAAVRKWLTRSEGQRAPSTERLPEWREVKKDRVGR